MVAIRRYRRCHRFSARHWYSGLQTDRFAEERNKDFTGRFKRHQSISSRYRIELDGTIITANENFLAATGYTLEEIKGANTRCLQPPSTARRLNTVNCGSI